MRQSWHIFLKDARRLRYEIIVVIAVTAAYAWLQGYYWTAFYTVRISPSDIELDMLRILLLPMAWWYLASLAVYGEAIPGDQQFWVTKPYRWTSLLGAKLLFIITFVSFSLLLADCSILTFQGLKPWENPAGLVWHELTVLATILLPMIAVACITDSFGRAVLISLGTILPFMVLDSILSSHSYRRGQFSVKAGWVGNSLADLVLLSAALAIVILQYRTRRTGVSCTIFVCAAAALVLGGTRLLPGDTLWALRTHLLLAGHRYVFHFRLFPPGSAPPPIVPVTRNDVPQNFARVTLPIRVDGVPSGTAATVDVMLGELTLPDGKPVKRLLWFGAGPYIRAWNEAIVERSLLEQLAGTPVRLHLAVYLTVLGMPHTEVIPVGSGPQRVPGVGLCESVPAWQGRTAFICRAPFRQPDYVLAQFDRLDQEVPSEQQRGSYSPLPADRGINPISESVWDVPNGATRVAITTAKPLAQIRRELDIPNVQLADFAN